MKFKFLKAAFVGVILSVSGLADASLIQSDYLTLGDGLAVYDDATNLTWLDLSLTRGLSYDQATNQHVGFAHASDSNVNTLLNNFFGTINYNKYGYTPTGEIELAPLFTELFGNADDIDRGRTIFSYGYFIDDKDFYRLAGANTAGQVFGPDYFSNQDRWKENGHRRNGVFLVRTGEILIDDPNLTKVPEPSTLAIFALGVIGLASRRFKKQS